MHACTMKACKPLMSGGTTFDVCIALFGTRAAMRAHQKAPIGAQSVGDQENSQTKRLRAKGVSVSDDRSGGRVAYAARKTAIEAHHYAIGHAGKNLAPHVGSYWREIRRSPSRSPRMRKPQRACNGVCWTRCDHGSLQIVSSLCFGNWCARCPPEIPRGLSGNFGPCADCDRPTPCSRET